MKGVGGMRAGGKRTMVVPPELAFGPEVGPHTPHTFHLNLSTLCWISWVFCVTKPDKRCSRSAEKMDEWQALGRGRGAERGHRPAGRQRDIRGGALQLQPALGFSA